MNNDVSEISNFNDLILEPDQRTMLIRLPYRIGYWISQSDQTGGAESDEQELNALEGIILSYGEDVCKSEFTQSLMEGTVAHYEEWDTWHKNIENVPKECETAIYLLKTEIPSKLLEDFQQTLFEIAETVALSYREIDINDDFLNKIYIQIRIWQKKWDAFVKKYDFSLDHVLNISPSEEAALSQLKAALRI